MWTRLTIAHFSKWHWRRRRWDDYTLTGSPVELGKMWLNCAHKHKTIVTPRIFTTSSEGRQQPARQLRSVRGFWILNRIVLRGTICGQAAAAAAASLSSEVVNLSKDGNVIGQLEVGRHGEMSMRHVYYWPAPSITHGGNMYNDRVIITADHPPEGG